MNKKKDQENEKSEKEILQEISDKLDRLMGILAIQNTEDPDEKIYTLKKLGFKSEEITSFVNVGGRI